MKIELVSRENKAPTLKDPVLVCGLPGSAFVGKFAVDHLASELGAKPFAEIYTDSFPPQVLINENGTAAMIRNELHIWKNSKSGAPGDLILLTGDAQPQTSEGEYALAEYIVDYVQRTFGLKRVITLGAYVTGSYAEKPKVFASATSPDLVKTLEGIGCELMAEGAITGMNGILVGIAKLKGVEALTLLGETSGYVFDPKASESVLNSLSKLVQISVDMRKLEDRAKEAQEALAEMERMRGVQQQQDEETQAGPAGERKRLDYIS